MDDSVSSLLVGVLDAQALYAKASERSRRGQKGSMSIGCLLGKTHFNKCGKLNCTCICHEIDGERKVQRSVRQ